MSAVDEQVVRLVREYAQSAPPGLLAPTLSLKDDLAVESLSLVSLVVRLGDELGVDVTEEGLDLGGLVTVGDVQSLARRIAERSPVQQT